MLYVKNVPVWERVLRMAVGIVGALFALTGLVGLCPMCALVGRKL